MVQISKICTTSPKFDEIKRTLKGQKRPFILLYINILYTKSQIRQFSADFHFHPRLRVRYNPVSIDSQSLTGLYFFKTSKMVTFGHRNAKGDLKTPQNRLFLFSVEDPRRDGLMEVDISSGSLEIWKMFVPLSHH